MMKKHWMHCIVILAAAARVSWASAETYTVTHTGDSGEGSLRWAIAQANIHAGADTIAFDIPLTDVGFNGTVWRIKPLTNLTNLAAGGTVIWGESQMLHQGETNTLGPEVFIDGSQNAETYGLGVTSSHNRISGIGVVNCQDFGIAVFGDGATDNVIAGCYVGTTPDGLGSEGNNKGILLYDGAARNRVGGTTPEERNVLSGNTNDGVHIDLADSNVVVGNYIGTDPSGLLANGNGTSGLGDGVDIRNQSQYNRVGGPTAEERNIISANVSAGLRFHGTGTSHNVAIGNTIGLDASGQSALPNILYGVFFHEQASDNRLGGLETGERNVVSGNAGVGVGLTHEGTTGNLIQGNWIGLAGDGVSAAPNGSVGVRLEMSACENQVGPGNVISGNASDGVGLGSAGTRRNQISGNWIGLNAAGQDTLANGGWGIHVESGSGSHQIGDATLGGNVVAGNRLGGIAVTDGACDSIQIVLNRMGMNGMGSDTLANDGPGLWLEGSFHHVDSNTMVGNQGHGVVLAQGATGITLADNAIGVGPSGQVWPNHGDGIRVQTGAQNDTLGPDNRIFSNTGWGVELADAGISGVTITANQISGNAAGGIHLVQGANGGIQPPVVTRFSPAMGTATPGARVEVFSDSADQGLFCQDAVMADAQGVWRWQGTPFGAHLTATATDGQGNTSAFSEPATAVQTVVTHTGDAGEGSLRWALDLANANAGPDTIRFDIPTTDAGFDQTVWRIVPVTPLPVLTDDGTVILGESQKQNQGNTNFIGPEIWLDGSGLSEGSGLVLRSALNRVSTLGLGGFPESGLAITGAAARFNGVKGNFIGCTANGQGADGNGIGILVADSAAANAIGGTTLSEMNLISGNLGDGLRIAGADSTQVMGNRIGTDATGFLANGNGGHGIVLTGGARFNGIGGVASGWGNLVSGNAGAGVSLSDNATELNDLSGNWIGLDASGRQALANTGPGLVLAGSGHHIEANAIAGNGGHGIMLADSATAVLIQNNDIGVGVQDKLVPNAGDGIWVSSHAHGSTLGPDNRIWANGGWGIDLADSSVQEIHITQNQISGNVLGGIYLAPDANGNMLAPVVASAQPPSGTATAGATVEVFSDSAGQGVTYEGTATADASGQWQWEGTVSGAYVTAVAIDGQGNSSTFSQPLSATVSDVVSTRVPKAFALHQNYPNPFNPVTTVLYDLPVQCHVNIIIYNVLGQPVKELVSDVKSAGFHRMQFDASALPSGLYFCRITAQDYHAVRKMVLLE